MYNGLNNGLISGLLDSQASGLHNGVAPGLSGPDDDRVGYCLEARMLFLAMTTQPDSIRKKLINAFIVGCKQDGNWNEIDSLFFLAAHSQQATLVDWKTPTSIGLEVNNPVYTVDTSRNGNGTSSYINTNWIANNSSIFMLNSASGGAYFRVNAAIGTERDFGSGTFGMNPRNGSNAVAGSLNSADGTLVTGSLNSSGLITIGRVNSTTVTAEINGVLIGSGAISVTTKDTFPVFIGCTNSAGTPISFSSRTMSFWYAGSGNVDRLKLYNRVQTYLTALGAAV